MILSKNLKIISSTSNTSYIKFWGTRPPRLGQEYIRYGGNTPCLEVRHKNDLVIIDAGTGIRALGDVDAIRKAKTIHLIIGHTHWDHIIGFPFFAPLYNPDCHVTIWSPIGFEKPTKELFTEMLGYAYFPVRLDDIRAKLTFKDIQEGVPFSIGEIQVNSHYKPLPQPSAKSSRKTFVCNRQWISYIMKPLRSPKTILTLRVSVSSKGDFP
jgi:phosphoribosyl 1,2-cyclic phosphodiesterase